MAAELVALVVRGAEKITRVSPAFPLSEKTLERLAHIVRGKQPGRRYYVAIVDEATWGSRKKELLYRWFAGEGFSHEEGWWVDG